MKTTIELPDATFRHLKTIAANRGITMKQVFTTALEEQVRVTRRKLKPAKRKRRGWLDFYF